MIENEDGFVSICALLCGDRLHLSDLTRDDRATLAALDRTLRPGDWCIVIGAGDGITAVAASRRTGNFGRVISHEPDLGKAQLLLENAAMNDAQGVQVLDVLSPSNAPLDLAGVAVPLRLAVVMPGHLNSDTLAFLRRVVDAAKVDYMLLPVLRSKDDSEWASTLGFMEYAAQRPCATLDSLDRRGRPTPITPIEIRVAERVDHLLIRFAA